MTTIAQRSFAGGELAPALYARVDTAKYTTGLRRCRNFFVMRHGGVATRPGTSFVAELKDSDTPARFIPFKFNDDQTYVLEFGDLYMRVHKDGVQLTESAKTITSISQANPAVVTCTAHGFSNGEEVYLSITSGMPELSGRNFKVASATANTFAITYLDGAAVDSSSFTAFSAGTVSRIYEITTPYFYEDLSEIQFVQSADVITLVHPAYEPRELARTGHTSWTLSVITFQPKVATPTGLAANFVGTATTPRSYNWKITAVDSETREESLASTSAGTIGETPLSASKYVHLTWTAVAGVQEYNVYREDNGVYGFVGVAGTNAFDDIGLSADTTDTPPSARNPFNGAGNFPSTVTYIQQRLGFANTNNEPENVWLSRSAQFKNFTVSSPVQHDDAVTFSMAGRQVNKVRHLLDLGEFVVLTTGGAHAVPGDSNGVIRPGELNPKQQSSYGANSLTPLVVGGTALYVQARGSIVRDLAFNFEEDGYRGNDLTIFSAHLFEGYTITSWDYQETPHSIVWAVRSDGILLGLTYVREHQVWAWHRHDFDGFVENVCVVPEGSEDAVYLIVRRTINGRTVRYIERLNSRTLRSIVDYVGLDCALSYDGRNTDASHTMTLSGGTTWKNTETLTLTSSASFFKASDVGNAIHLKGSDGTQIRFTIKEYVSGTQIKGKPQKTVPAGMRSVAITDWSRAVDQISGLWHIEGKKVSVFADGFVVANPNNESYEVLTVTNGSLTLARPYSVIHVGLPITADLETLDIDTDQGEPLVGKKINIGKVTLHVESSRGIFVGGTAPDSDSDFSNLDEVQVRSDESYDDPVSLITDKVELNIKPEWNSNGRIFIRQSDPIPLSVLAVAPQGMIPLGR